MEASISTRRYCSEKCKAEANKRRKRNGRGKGWSKDKQFVARQKCIICGELFYAPPAQIKRGKEFGACFCSQRCYGEFVGKNPKRFPMTKTRRSKGGYREDLNQYFRSSWEANYARYLNWLISLGEIEHWEYEPDTFEFVGIQRGTRFYTPDFKIFEKDGSYEYHEVKGWMDPKSKTKLKRMKKYYPNERLVLVDKDAYYALARDVKQLISNWEQR